MSLMDDETLIPDEATLEEWMTQVFEVATLQSRKDQTPDGGCQVTRLQILGRFTPRHKSMISSRH